MPRSAAAASSSKEARPRGKPRGIRRDRDCRSCKDRGIKCDLNRPRCLPCVEAKLPCGGWPQRIVWTGETRPQGPSVAAAKRSSSSSSSSSRKHGVDAGPRKTTRAQLGSSDGNNTAPSRDPAAKPIGTQAYSSHDTTVPPSTEDIPTPYHPDAQSEDCQQIGLAERLSTLCNSLKFAQKSIEGHGFSADKVSQLVPRINAYLQARVQMTTSAATDTAAAPPSLPSLSQYPPVPHPGAPPDLPGLTTPTAPAGGGAPVIGGGGNDTDTAEFYRLTALASLSEALETAHPVAFLGIAVFAFFEVVMDADFGAWQVHLRGARSLLDHHCSRREDLDSLLRRVTGFAELLAYFAWWDVIGTVIRRLSGHPGADERLIFLDWHRTTMGDEFFGTVGCHPETFRLLISLAETAADLQGGNPLVAAEEVSRQRSRYAQAMGQLLLLGSDATDDGRCRDTWRCAAAIAVLTWHSSHATATARVAGKADDGPGDDDNTRAALDAAVDRICEVLAEASPSSQFYTHMATPAFFAGINATSLRQCNVLRMYWGRCRIGKHPRYWGARAECEERWRRKGIVL